MAESKELNEPDVLGEIQNQGGGDICIAAAPDCAGGGRKIEIHLDSPDGPLVGSLAPASTGDWFKFKVQTTAVKDVTGPHAIVLRFRGGSGVCNLNRLRFLN